MGNEKAKRERTHDEISIRKMLDNYRAKLSPEVRSWIAITGAVDLSRHTAEDSYNYDTDVQRDSIIKIAFSLEITDLEDFNFYLRFNGFSGLRNYIPRDMIIIDAINNRDFDCDRLNDRLLNAGEKPLYRRKRCDL